MPGFLDLALVYDPVTRGCDLVIDPLTGDLVLDETPVPAMLNGLGIDGRARVDDALPSGLTSENQGLDFVARRGWVGDVCDVVGERAGCRLWLMDREHETDEVADRARRHAVDGLARLAREGHAVTVTAEWITQVRHTGVLALTCRVDDAALTVRGVG
jgi:phage gp46-like protein